MEVEIQEALKWLCYAVKSLAFPVGIVYTIYSQKNMPEVCLKRFSHE